MANGKPGSIGMRPLLLIGSAFVQLGATALAQSANPAASQASEPNRSEERRVGKECQ